MSKDEILEGYLNTIFFGRGAYGIAAASQAYFGVDVRAITDPGRPPAWPASSGRRRPAEPTRAPRRGRPAPPHRRWSPWRRRATSPRAARRGRRRAGGRAVGRGASSGQAHRHAEGRRARTTTWAPTTCRAYVESELKRIDPRLHRRDDPRRRPPHLHVAQLRPAAGGLAGRLQPRTRTTRHPRGEGDPEAAHGGGRRPGPRAGHGGQPPPYERRRLRGELRRPRQRLAGASPGRRSSRSSWPRPSARATRSTPATTPRARWSSSNGRPTASLEGQQLLRERRRRHGPHRGPHRSRPTPRTPS